jgi:hypothetical protein
MASKKEDDDARRAEEEEEEIRIYIYKNNFLGAVVGWLSSFTTVWFSSRRPFARATPAQTRQTFYTSPPPPLHYYTMHFQIDRRITTTLPDVGFFSLQKNKIKCRNCGGSCFKILEKNENQLLSQWQPIIHNSLCI